MEWWEDSIVYRYTLIYVVVVFLKNIALFKMHTPAPKRFDVENKGYICELILVNKDISIA